MPKVSPASERLYGPLLPGFGRRVDQAIGEFKSKAAAAEVMGLSTDQLANIVAERSVPNFVAMCALADKAGVSLYWLAFGDGPQQASDISTRKSFSAADDTVALTRIDTGPSMRFSREWLQRTFNRSPEQLRLLDAPGSAMEPTIRRNALLIVESDAPIVDGEIFVFSFGGDRVVRRTQRNPDGSLNLSADSPQVEPLRLNVEKALTTAVVGRVAWIGTPI